MKCFKFGIFCRYDYGGGVAASVLSRNNNVHDCADKTRRTSMKKEEKGSSRRRYDDNDNNNNDNNDVDMDGRGREAEGEGERWWNNHRCMQHGQHPRVPTGNYDGGYDNEDIPVIPALDLGNAANHFLALAVLMLAFLLLSSLLLLSSSLRMATATAVAS